MASHKPLKSVVRSVVDSFTSMLNYSHDDYFMSHVIAVARRTGCHVLYVDLLTGRLKPKELLVPEVASTVVGYSLDFPDLVRRSGSDPAFVVKAHLTLQLEISPNAAADRAGFVCTCTVEDDRGKEYEGSVSGVW